MPWYVASTCYRSIRYRLWRINCYLSSKKEGFKQSVVSQRVYYHWSLKGLEKSLSRLIMNESSNSAPLTPICKRWILHRKTPSFISYDVIMHNSRNMYKHIVPYLATLYTSDVVYSKWSTVIVETIMHVIIIYLHYHIVFAIYYLFQPVNLKGCPYPYVIRATITFDGYIIKIHIEMPYSNKAKGAICTAIRQAAIKIYTMI